VTQRQAALLDNHKDTAQLMCSLGDFFWVLDLEDTEGFKIAVAMEPDDARGEVRVAERRNSVTPNHIPAQTAVTPYALGCEMLAHGWSCTPPPPDGRYVAVVSDGRILIAAVKPLNPLESQPNPHHLWH